MVLEIALRSEPAGFQLYGSDGVFPIVDCRYVYNFDVKSLGATSRPFRRLMT